MRRRGVVFIVSAVAAGVLVVGAAGTVAWHYTRPRLPAVAAVDPATARAIVAVVNAAGDLAAVTVTGLVATTACQHTMFARGSIYTRTANLYTDAGAEGALLDRIAAGLPATFHVSRANPLDEPVAPLRGSAGAGVSLSVDVISPGWISATARTDCRAGVGPSRPSTAGPVPPDVAALFSALGTSAASWHQESDACAAGALTTVDAVSATAPSAALAGRLAAVVPATARRFTTPSNRIIWRDGTTSTVVASSDDGTHITVQRTTATCGS
jgi:uncharacterized iron-regulated membrane protein